MRKFAATLLVILGCVLAIPAVVAFWLDRELTDQSRYLAAVAPLADNPDVKQAVAKRMTEAIVSKVEFRVLPESVVSAAVNRVVSSDAFDRIWAEINQAAQPQLVAMLRGETSALRIEGEAIVLDLAPVAVAVKSELVASGHQFAASLPAVDASFELYSSQEIALAQKWFKVLEKSSTWLPLVAIGLIIIGIGILPSRFLLAAIGMAIAMLIVALVVWLGRRQVVNAADSPAAMGAIYDAFTGYLKRIVWWTFGIAAALAIATYFAMRRHAAPAR